MFYQQTANRPQDESMAQEKVEVTSENDTANNHSNGYAACVQRNKENIDKGSDAQVSVLPVMVAKQQLVLGFVL